MSSILNNSLIKTYKPLDQIIISSSQEGYFTVTDGAGVEYWREEIHEKNQFLAGGSLGNHTIRIYDTHGNEMDRFRFKVFCETAISDEKGVFKELLAILHQTMRSFHDRQSTLMNGKVYRYFVWWLRDHVHTLKGMKYFHEDLRSAIELYRDSQREDGMIYDLIEPRTPWRTESDERFDYDNFIKPVEDGWMHFKRIPVENDVEYLFVEGIYYTWKATGDDGWMEGMLDSAIKSYEYTMTSPYRWSEKYDLLKRSFTVDTWDFQCDEDARINGNDIMAVHKDRARFGIMHGDNTGFAVGCRYLAEMLEYVGKEEEADTYRKLGQDIMERLDRLAWNGNFYTHHIPEDESIVRDLGVDQSKQLSLSNAYNLNRDITHEQCVSIIKEYLHISKNLPYGSPGEWYTIYPPFEWGFEEACGKWDYINGGVTPIVAGELAHGAFEHGFEEYGVDILRRILKLAKNHNNYLDCCYKGALPKEKEANYKMLDLSQAVNASESIPGWRKQKIESFNEILSGISDMKGIPVLVPGISGKDGMNCIGLCDTESRSFMDRSSMVHYGFDSGSMDLSSGVVQRINGRPTFVGYDKISEGVQSCTIEVGDKAKTLFFLHTLAGNGLAGDVTIEYEDGSTYTKYIEEDKDIINWWLPKEPDYYRNSTGNLVIAWEGRNHVCGRVGVSLFGLENPLPEITIEKIHLNAARNGNYWAVLGITLSDGTAAIKQFDLSFGIPDNWGAANVTYGLIEGLAGVVD